MTEHAELAVVGGRVFDGSSAPRARPSRSRTAESSASAATPMYTSSIGDQTRVLEARGGLIHPAFVDAHAHAVFAGVERLSIDLTPARERRGDPRADPVGERSAAPPNWLTGGGWSHELLPIPRAPARRDRAGPPRRTQRCRPPHAVGQLRALEFAGIDRDTPQPHNGTSISMATATRSATSTRRPQSSSGDHPAGRRRRDGTPGCSTRRSTSGRSASAGWHEAILGEYNGKADCTPAFLRGIADKHAEAA